MEPAAVRISSVLGGKVLLEVARPFALGEKGVGEKQPSEGRKNPDGSDANVLLEHTVTVETVCTVQV